MSQFSQNHAISPRTWVLAGMIAFAVCVRLLIYFVPGLFPYNFTPVEAIALFGGAYFADRRLAFGVPLAAMLLADLVIATALPREWIGDWLGTLPAVYGCIALTVVGGLSLSRRISAFRVTGYAFASAVLFFLVTNFATWIAAHGGAGEACTHSRRNASGVSAAAAEMVVRLQNCTPVSTSPSRSSPSWPSSRSRAIAAASTFSRGCRPISTQGFAP